MPRKKREHRFMVDMVCKEIWRARTIVEIDIDDKEVAKDKAWAKFDKICSPTLEQENFTRVTKRKP